MIVCVAQPQSCQYKKLKRRLKINTAVAGVGLVASVASTQGGEAALSALVGSGASVAYVSSLCDFVDGLGTQEAPLQKHIGYPVALAVFESVMNHHLDGGFHFHYDATLIGFLAYQFALLSCLYDEVKKMLIP